MGEDAVRQPGAAQVVEVRDHALGAGQHDHVRVAPFLGAAHGPEAHVRFGGEGREVRKVGDVPEHDHGDVQRSRLLGSAVGVLAPREARHVLFGDVEVADVGDGAEHGHAGVVEQVLMRGAEQGGVPPEAVDEVAGEQAAFGVGEGHPCAEEGGVDPAPVDVPDEQDRGAGVVGHPHVHEVVAFEVDLSGAARAFEDHDVVLGGEGVVGFGNGAP